MGFCFEAGADEDTYFRATSLETLRQYGGGRQRHYPAAGAGGAAREKRDGVVYLPCIKPEPRRPSVWFIVRALASSRYEHLAEAIRGTMDGHFKALKQVLAVRRATWYASAMVGQLKVVLTKYQWCC